jgi:hypothetical protein
MYSVEVSTINYVTVKVFYPYSTPSQPSPSPASRLPRRPSDADNRDYRDEVKPEGSVESIFPRGMRVWRNAEIEVSDQG